MASYTVFVDGSGNLFAVSDIVMEHGYIPAPGVRLASEGERDLFLSYMEKAQIDDTFIGKLTPLDTDTAKVEFPIPPPAPTSPTPAAPLPFSEIKQRVNEAKIKQLEPTPEEDK